MRSAPVTIFEDAQADIWRMASDDPVPRDQGRGTRRRPPSEGAVGRVGIRWCPGNRGVKGNEVAGEWVKLAADEPGAHGVEWLTFGDPSSQIRTSQLHPVHKHCGCAAGQIRATIDRQVLHCACLQTLFLRLLAS